MEILDCNLTYGAVNNGKPFRNCDTFAELLAETDRAGISGGLVKCRYSDTVGVNYGNRFAAKDVAAAREKGLPFWGVWAALPPYTDETPAPEELPGEMQKNNVAAVYLAPGTHRYVPDRLTLGRLLGVLQERKIPVILNTANGVSMELIYKIMAAFPKLAAVVGDCDCWPNARRLYPLAYEYENLRTDLSFVMDAGGVEDMTRRFGAEKLLFGTAFPARYTGSMLAVVRAADISENEKEMIFGKNLRQMITEACYDQ